MVCRSSLLGSRLVEDKIVLGNVSWQFGLSSFVLGVGLGLSIRWAGVAKFFDPTMPICLNLEFNRVSKEAT